MRMRTSVPHNAALLIGLLVLPLAAPGDRARAAAGWQSANGFRVLLTVDAPGRPRSNSPASVEIDFQQLLREQGACGTFDEHSVEILAGAALSRRVPHRIDRLFGASKVTVHFIVPDQ